MIKSTKAPIPNGIVFITDPSIGAVPDHMPGHVAATPTCIVVATQHLIDGETEITISDDAGPDSPGLTSAFDGMLELPNRRVVILANSIEGNNELDTLISVDVAASPVRIRVWMNDFANADRVHVLLSAVD